MNFKPFTYNQLPTYFIAGFLIALILVALYNHKFRCSVVDKQPIFYIGLIIALISTILLMLNGYEKFQILMINEVTGFFITLSITCLIALWELSLRHKKLKNKYQELSKSSHLFKEIDKFNTDESLKNYIDSRKYDALVDVRNLTRVLKSTGYKGETKEKIKILEGILKHINLRGNKILSFYATTLNSPSEMWSKFDRMWSLQKELMKWMSEDQKKRYVIISKEDLHFEITAKNELLKEFIEWHIANKFELRFIFEHKEDFKKQMSQYADISSNFIINDFAIIEGKNQRCVFGEEIESNMIRLIIDNEENKENKCTIDEFKQFYEYLRNQRTFPERTAYQILSECVRINSKQKYTLADIYTFYESFIFDQDSNLQTYLLSLPPAIQNQIHLRENISGDDYITFARTLFSGIAQQGDEFIALDLTATKLDFLTWINTVNYEQWMQASIKLAKTGCRCSRIFVLNKIEHDNATKSLIVNNILLPHIIAGIKVYLVSEFELFDRNIPYCDFLMIKDKFCHSLAIWQNFDNTNQPLKSENSINDILSNLEILQSFHYYEHIYNDILFNKNQLQTLTHFTESDYQKTLDQLNQFYSKHLLNLK